LKKLYDSVVIAADDRHFRVDFDLEEVNGNVLGHALYIHSTE